MYNTITFLILIVNFIFYIYTFYTYRRMDQSNFNKAKIHHRQRLLKQVIERFHSNTIKCSQQQRLSVSSNNHYHITFIRHALMQWNNRIFTNLHQQYTMIKRSIHFWKVWRQVLLFIYLKQNVLRGQKKRAKLIGDKTTKSNSTSNAVKFDNVLVKNSLIINNNEHVSGQKNSMRALLTKLNLLVQSSGSDTNETFSSVNHVPKNDVNNIQEQFKSNIIDSRMSRSTGSSGGSSSGNNYNYSAATSSALMKPRPLPEAAKSFSGRTCMMNLVTRDSSKDSKDSRDSRQADLRLARDIILFVQEMRAKG